MSNVPSSINQGVPRLPTLLLERMIIALDSFEKTLPDISCQMLLCFFRKALRFSAVSLAVPLGLSIAVAFAQDWPWARSTHCLTFPLEPDSLLCL